MQMVGDRLGQIAQGEDDIAARDLFARSAFNRYYYAAFLKTILMLQELNPEWRKKGHSDIPILLTKTIWRKIQKKARSMKASPLREDAAKLSEEANAALTALAELLTKAYLIRKVADYEPEDKVTFEDSVVRLSACTLESARSWVDQADQFGQPILRTWRLLEVY